MQSTPVPRPSARVLVTGPGGTLLFLHFRNGTGPTRTTDSYWITPGGSIHPGEPPAHAAARELAEETGIQATPGHLGPVVAYATGEWSAGDQVFAAHDSYFHLRVGDTAIDTAGQEELERSLMIGHRWWNLPGLARTHERVVPPRLASLIRTLLADGPPPAPIRLPWHPDGES